MKNVTLNKSKIIKPHFLHNNLDNVNKSIEGKKWNLAVFPVLLDEVQ